MSMFPRFVKDYNYAEVQQRVSEFQSNRTDLVEIVPYLATTVGTQKTGDILFEKFLNIYNNDELVEQFLKVINKNIQLPTFVWYQFVEWSVEKKRLIGKDVDTALLQLDPEQVKKIFKLLNNHGYNFFQEFSTKILQLFSQDRDYDNLLKKYFNCSNDKERLAVTNVILSNSPKLKSLRNAYECAFKLADMTDEDIYQLALKKLDKIYEIAIKILNSDEELHYNFMSGRIIIGSSRERLVQEFGEKIKNKRQLHNILVYALQLSTPIEILTNDICTAFILQAQKKPLIAGDAENRKIETIQLKYNQLKKTEQVEVLKLLKTDSTRLKQIDPYKFYNALSINKVQEIPILIDFVKLCCRYTLYQFVVNVVSGVSIFLDLKQSGDNLQSAVDFKEFDYISEINIDEVMKEMKTALLSDPKKSEPLVFLIKCFIVQHFTIGSWHEYNVQNEILKARREVDIINEITRTQLNQLTDFQKRQVGTWLNKYLYLSNREELDKYAYSIAFNGACLIAIYLSSRYNIPVDFLDNKFNIKYPESPLSEGRLPKLLNHPNFSSLVPQCKTLDDFLRCVQSEEAENRNHVENMPSNNSQREQQQEVDIDNMEANLVQATFSRLKKRQQNQVLKLLDIEQLTPINPKKFYNAVSINGVEEISVLINFVKICCRYNLINFLKSIIGRNKALLNLYESGNQLNLAFHFDWLSYLSEINIDELMEEIQVALLSDQKKSRPIIFQIKKFVKNYFTMMIPQEYHAPEEIQKAKDEIDIINQITRTQLSQLTDLQKTDVGKILQHAQYLNNEELLDKYAYSIGFNGFCLIAIYLSLLDNTKVEILQQKVRFKMVVQEYVEISEYETKHALLAKLLIILLLNDKRFSCVVSQCKTLDDFLRLTQIEETKSSLPENQDISANHSSIDLLKSQSRAESNKSQNEEQPPLNTDLVQGIYNQLKKTEQVDIDNREADLVQGIFSRLKKREQNQVLKLLDIESTQLTLIQSYKFYNAISINKIEEDISSLIDFVKICCRYSLLWFIVDVLQENKKLHNLTQSDSEIDTAYNFFHYDYISEINIDQLMEDIKNALLKDLKKSQRIVFEIKQFVVVNYHGSGLGHEFNVENEIRKAKHEIDIINQITKTQLNELNNIQKNKVVKILHDASYLSESKELDQYAYSIGFNGFCLIAIYLSLLDDKDLVILFQKFYSETTDKLLTTLLDDKRFRCVVSQCKTLDDFLRYTKVEESKNSSSENQYVNANNSYSNLLRLQHRDEEVSSSEDEIQSEQEENIPSDNESNEEENEEQQSQPNATKLSYSKQKTIDILPWKSTLSITKQSPVNVYPIYEISSDEEETTTVKKQRIKSSVDDKSTRDTILYIIGVYVKYQFDKTKLSPPQFYGELCFLDTQEKILVGETILLKMILYIPWDNDKDLANLLCKICDNDTQFNLLLKTNRYDPNKKLCQPNFTSMIANSLSYTSTYQNLLQGFNAGIICKSLYQDILQRNLRGQSYDAFLDNLQLNWTYEQWQPSESLKMMEKIIDDACTDKPKLIKNAFKFFSIQLYATQDQLTNYMVPLFCSKIPNATTFCKNELMAHLLVLKYKKLKLNEQMQNIIKLNENEINVEKAKSILKQIDRPKKKSKSNKVSLWGNYYLESFLSLPIKNMTISKNIDDDSSEDEQTVVEQETEDQMTMLDNAYENGQWATVLKLANKQWLNKHLYDSESMFPTHLKQILKQNLHMNEKEEKLNMDDICKRIKKHLLMDEIGLALCLYHDHKDNIDLDQHLAGQFIQPKFLDEIKNKDPWKAVKIPAKYSKIKMPKNHLNLLARLNEFKHIGGDVENEEQNTLLKYMETQLSTNPNDTQMLDWYLYAKDHNNTLPFTMNQIIARSNNTVLPLKKIDQLLKEYDKLNPIVQEIAKPLLDAVKIDPNSYLLRQMYENSIKDKSMDDATQNLVQYEERTTKQDLEEIEEYLDTSIAEMTYLEKKCMRSDKLKLTYKMAGQTLQAIRKALQSRKRMSDITKEYLENKVIPTLQRFDDSVEKLGVKLNNSVLGRRATIGLETGENAEMEMKNLCKIISNSSGCSNVQQMKLEAVNNEFIENNSRIVQLKELQKEFSDETTTEFLHSLLDIEKHLLRQQVTSTENIINKTKDDVQIQKIVQQLKMLWMQKQFDEFFEMLSLHYDMEEIWVNLIPNLLAQHETNINYIKLQTLYDKYL